MEEFIDKTQVDEIMAISNVFDTKAKIHSYKLFAEVMEKI
jgi:hypothetical protein